MAKCALPSKIIKDNKGNEVNLRDALHYDWPFWPLTKIPRGLNAFGPRCPGKECPECGGKSFRPWPPTLVEGHGIARWEMEGEGHSIIFIPSLVDKTIKAKDVYNRVHDAIECNPGKMNYGNWGRIQLLEGEGYSPSAIQKFSDSGWMKLSPYYYAEWHVFKRYAPKDAPVWVEDKEPLAAFYRWAYRPDHNDEYYNWGPYAGLHFE